VSTAGSTGAILRDDPRVITEHARAGDLREVREKTGVPEQVTPALGDV
jgi:hypothetical protein